jgi:dual specificity tyrosine-phosphorylation-regulated kinase 2/3/4
VHFLNILERKKPGGFTQPTGTHNHGYDNDNGEYIFEMHDHIMYKYELIKKLGKGSFGVVLKAFDHFKKEFVALKIIRNRKRLHKQGLIEAKLLQHLKDHDNDDKKNIVRIKEYFMFRNHVVCRTI